VPISRQPGQTFPGLPRHLDARIVISHGQRSTSGRAERLCRRTAAGRAARKILLITESRRL
jgi:hypothetical protein